MPYLVNLTELLDVFVNYTGNRRFILHKTIRELKFCLQTAPHPRFNLSTHRPLPNIFASDRVCSMLSQNHAQVHF